METNEELHGGEFDTTNVCIFCCCQYSSKESSLGENVADNEDLLRLYNLTMKMKPRPDPEETKKSKRGVKSNQRLKLAGSLSVCSDCFAGISSAMSRSRRVETVETNVRRLQKDLLQELYKLEEELKELYLEMKKIEDIVQYSDELYMKEYVRSRVKSWNDDMSGVLEFRKAITTVANNLKLFNTKLNSSLSGSPQNVTVVEYLVQETGDIEVKLEPDFFLKDDYFCSQSIGEEMEANSSVGLSSDYPVENDYEYDADENDDFVLESSDAHDNDDHNDSEVNFKPSKSKRCNVAKLDDNRNRELPTKSGTVKMKKKKRKRNEPLRFLRFRCSKGCGRSFKVEDYMVSHSLSCDGVQLKSREYRKRAETLTCDICGKVWIASFTTLTRHKWSHKSEEEKAEAKSRGEQDPKEIDYKHYYSGKVQCSVCGKLLSNKVYLKKHMSMVHLDEKEKEENRLQCHLCPKTFANKKSLDGHVRYTHKLAKEVHQCHLCDKKFQTLSQLKSHILYHSDERPFHCENGSCGLCFKSAKNLKEHAKTCTGKPRKKKLKKSPNEVNLSREVILEQASVPSNLIPKFDLCKK